MTVYKYNNLLVIETKFKEIYTISITSFGYWTFYDIALTFFRLNKLSLILIVLFFKNSTFVRVQIHIIHTNKF